MVIFTFEKFLKSKPVNFFIFLFATIPPLTSVDRMIQ